MGDSGKPTLREQLAFDFSKFTGEYLEAHSSTPNSIPINYAAIELANPHIVQAIRDIVAGIIDGDGNSISREQLSDRQLLDRINSAIDTRGVVIEVISECPVFRMTNDRTGDVWGEGTSSSRGGTKNIYKQPIVRKSVPRTRGNRTGKSTRRHL